MRERAVRYSIALCGSAILAFGLYHIHSCAGVTEGGVLGATLLLQHWFSLSPAISGLVLNAVCYLIGAHTLGREFVLCSAVSTGGFCAVYAVCEQFPPLWPQLYGMPLVAALIGAVFVGVGAGLCVLVGGAPSGDDALAMSLARITRRDIRYMYLISDVVVLGLSTTYIPWQRLIWSLLTVVLSGQIIGWIQHIPLYKNGRKP